MSLYDGYRLDPCWRVRSLTERERVVLHHMMEGHSAEWIKIHEHVSLATVRSHIRSIMFKLDCTSQLQVVAYVRRLQCPDDTERRALVDAVLVSVS